MEFTSLTFLLFVLGVLIVYHFLPQRKQNYWLLIASYGIYISWSWKFALLLLGATIFNFVLARYLRREGQGRVTFLWLGIVANVVLFVIFKAASFYLFRLAALLEQMGIQSGLGGLQIIIPLGLSYYVVQNISYLVDVYRGQIPASTNWVDFGLYLVYFPKIVAGPIERARTFLPILARPRQVDNQTLSRTIVLVLVGLTRKLLIADLLFAHIPWGNLIDEPSVFSRIELIGWLVIYAFALYNDFAGYTSIARGVSGLFGIELSPNFNTPYFSKSFSEFWNRWHITLSHWLRDYIFFPVSRALARRFPNRFRWQNLVIPPIITMLVSGFWHGPNWQMLLWGALHGVYLVGERLLSLRPPSQRENQKFRWPDWASSSVLFLLVILAWVPFALRIPNALAIWKQLLIGPIFGLNDNVLIFPLVLLIPTIGLDWAQYNKAEETFFLHQRQFVQAVMLATVIVFILVVTSSGQGQPFVYQGF